MSPRAAKAAHLWQFKHAVVINASSFWLYLPTFCLMFDHANPILRCRPHSHRLLPSDRSEWIADISGRGALSGAAARGKTTESMAPGGGGEGGCGHSVSRPFGSLRQTTSAHPGRVWRPDLLHAGDGGGCADRFGGFCGDSGGGCQLSEQAVEGAGGGAAAAFVSSQ